MKEYQESQIKEMAEDFQQGAVIAFPTDTVYGVGSIYGDLDALNRLKMIKHRPETKPIPMMASRLETYAPYVKLSPMAQKIADTFLPGPLTLIVELTDFANRDFFNGKSTAAIRIPNAPTLLKVMDCLDRPLMVSSANVSGEPAALTKQEAMAMLKELDGILDGTCHELQASTIVDCTQDKPKILREGPITLAQIEAALEK